MLLNIISYIFSGLWAMVWICGGILIYDATPNQIKKDRRFIDNEFKPKIAIIERFKKVNGRLPTSTEFDSLMNIDPKQLGSSEYIRDIRYVEPEISGDLRDVDWSKNYVLQIWRGEWFEYYISSKRKFLTNNYKTSDGIIAAFLVYPLVGLTPFILMWLYFKLKKPRLMRDSN